MKLIATRTLTLRADAGEVDVPVNVFAPQDKGNHWACRFEIGWPEAICVRDGRGIDAVQALVIALNMIAAHVYTSEHHGAGRADVARARRGLWISRHAWHAGFSHGG